MDALLDAVATQLLYIVVCVMVCKLKLILSVCVCVCVWCARVCMLGPVLELSRDIQHLYVSIYVHSSHW